MPLSTCLRMKPPVSKAKNPLHRAVSNECGLLQRIPRKLPAPVCTIPSPGADHSLDNVVPKNDKVNVVPKNDKVDCKEELASFLIC